jgi:hypothetical protein
MQGRSGSKWRGRYEEVVKLELQALYLKFAEANKSEDFEEARRMACRIMEIDDELKAKGYVIRMLCVGCGSIALIKDRNNFWGAHCNARAHAGSHERMEQDIFGEPIHSGTYAWTDSVIHVFFL